nr:hypothetical protein [Burkholderia pseudomallei]
MDDAVWNHSTFSKNRDRLLAHDIIVGLFNETVETEHARDCLSGVILPQFLVQSKSYQIF